MANNLSYGVRGVTLLKIDYFRQSISVGYWCIMAFIFCNPNPDRIIVDDCVIRGISILTNSFWEDIYLDICNEGFLNGKLFRC